MKYSLFSTVNAHLPTLNFCTSRSMYHINESCKIFSTSRKTNSVSYLTIAPFLCIESKQRLSFEFTWRHVTSVEIFSQFSNINKVNSFLEVNFFPLLYTCLHITPRCFVLGRSAGHSSFVVSIFSHHALQDWAVRTASFSCIKMRSGFFRSFCIYSKMLGGFSTHRCTFFFQAALHYAQIYFFHWWSATLKHNTTFTEISLKWVSRWFPKSWQ